MRRILLLQTAFVGDLLLSIPLILRLKSLFPGVQIDLICRKGMGALMKSLALVDDCFEIDKSKNDKRVDPEIFRRDYELLLCPHQSFTSARIARRVKASKKIGFKRFWNFWAFDVRLERQMRYPEALRQLGLLLEIDPEVKEFFATNERSYLFDEGSLPAWSSMLVDQAGDIRKYDSLFEKPVCFLAPGSVWKTKRWTATGFSGAARHFSAKGFRICLVGAPGEEAVCREVEERVEGSINLCGQTSLFETYLLFKRGRVLIANDSGAMHLAAVAGLPCVAVFGPTTLDLGYRPWQESAVVVQKDLSCRPCGLHGGHQCPIGTHECMEGIAASEVVFEAEKLIGSLSH